MPAPDYAAEIEALEAAAASGELTVESDGDRVTYRSTSDLLKMLDYFRDKAALVAVARPSAVSLAVFDGG
ncbi:MAG: hypothetical protein DI552_00190 [Brevundimonas sp.]|uniref:phage head-tail joining protein n=1 Tax=Brevundimonas sp. TaxID=1871086 RepID=UPI000DBC1245|nr:hypothetical protein [Brevundimonas sp.]PZU62324.1 MAG: hypothetical protein DI552_00190 [Brevundimonas sp.]